MATVSNFLQPNNPSFGFKSGGGGSGGVISGLSDLFTSIGTTFANVYNSVNPPSFSSGQLPSPIFIPQPTGASQNSSLILVLIALLAGLLFGQVFSGKRK